MRHGALFVAGTVAVATIAAACAGDWGYQNQWRPEAGIAMLTPANDTRSNFILLMADRHGTSVAHQDRLRQPYVPIEMSYASLVKGLYAQGDPSADAGQTEPDWGLSEGSDYDWSSGNRRLCHSNKTGAVGFSAALNADRAVPKDEAAALIGARQALAKACDKAAEQKFDLPHVQSRGGKAYRDYLEGARLFYAEALEDARARFAHAAEAPSPWVRETSRYMLFRIALLTAVDGTVDEYGGMAEPSERDQAAIDRAEAARQAYLKAYPTGLYARSATDLSRRVAWLRGDRAAMGTAYSTLLRNAAAQDGLPNLDTMTEIDRRLLPSPDGEGVTDPALLAIVDLMRLRPTVEWDEERSLYGPLLTHADLERQRPVFADVPDLFGYLLAAEAFFGRQKPAEVLALIPDAAHQAKFSYVQFSRQMLRGLALEAVNDRNARAFWVSLLPGAVQPYQRGAIELAIYQHDRAAGMVGRLLETGSPILHPLIRSRIIEVDATPSELRRTVKTGLSSHEREVALYMLLGNEIRYGLYSDFLADQALVAAVLAGRPQSEDNDGNWSTESFDADYGGTLGAAPIDDFAVNKGATKACPILRSTVTALAANGRAIRPLLCLAEFIRGNGFDNWDEFYDPSTGKWAPNRRKGYNGQPLTRARIYHIVMDAPGAADDDRAFALNRAIRCYQPSGNNDCGGDAVPVATRKAWFQRLKTRYPNTSWAKELKYYW